MEILHEEINNWLIIDVVILVVLCFLTCILLLVIVSSKYKISRIIGCIIISTVYSIIAVTDNHNEKVIIVKVNDWNEYHDFINSGEWTIQEENGNVIKLNKYY